MKRRRQAFRQAPWRVQLRLTGGAALPLIAFLMVSGIYLAVNAKVANAGREVLSLERRLQALQRENSEMVTRLAEVTSPVNLINRAFAMGFRTALPADIEYLVIEGYTGAPDFMAPQPPSATLEGESVLSPAYTETLGEWLSRWLGGVTP